MVGRIVDVGVIRDGYESGGLVLSPVDVMAVPAPGVKRVGAFTYQTTSKTPLRCWEYLKFASKLGIPMSRLINDALLLHMDVVLGLDGDGHADGTQGVASASPVASSTPNASDMADSDIVSTKLDKIIEMLDDKTHYIPQAAGATLRGDDLSDFKRDVAGLHGLLATLQGKDRDAPRDDVIDDKSVDAMAGRLADAVIKRQEESLSDMRDDVRSLASVVSQLQASATQERRISIDTTAHDRLVADMASVLERLCRIIERLDRQEKTIADMGESMSDCTDEVRACSDEVHLIASALYEYDDGEEEPDDGTGGIGSEDASSNALPDCAVPDGDLADESGSYADGILTATDGQLVEEYSASGTEDDMAHDDEGDDERPSTHEENADYATFDDYEADFARTVREILGRDASASTSATSSFGVINEDAEGGVMGFDGDYGVSADEFAVDGDGAIDDEEAVVDCSDVDDMDVVSDDDGEDIEGDVRSDVGTDTGDMDFERMFDDIADGDARHTDHDTEGVDDSTPDADFDIDDAFDGIDGASASFDGFGYGDSMTSSADGITVPQRRHGRHKTRGKWHS